MSQHGSEPATVEAAGYKGTWLRTGHSGGCWLCSPVVQVKKRG